MLNVPILVILAIGAFYVALSIYFIVRILGGYLFSRDSR
jgi:hypothetical protein